MTTYQTPFLSYLNDAAFICGFEGWGKVPDNKRIDIANLAASLHRNAILQEVSNALQEQFRQS